MEMHIHGTLVQDHELSEEHASRLRILQNTVASYTFEVQPLRCSQTMFPQPAS